MPKPVSYYILGFCIEFQVGFMYHVLFLSTMTLSDTNPTLVA